MSPLRGSRLITAAFPTAGAVGYRYFVGFANWLPVTVQAIVVRSYAGIIEQNLYVGLRVGPLALLVP